MRGRLIDAAAVTGGIVLGENPETPFSGVSTDSRTVTKGELFIALRGDNFDGHDYIGQAFERGASAAVVENEPAVKGFPAILVGNTLDALASLAASHRMAFDLKLIGITGSAGKTTVKEMIASILALKGNVLKTQKNFNNLIGVPMRLLDLGDEHDYAVIEMGTNSPGEIGRLAAMALPSVSVLTGIVPAHLKGLGSMDGILKEKQSIFEYTTETAVFDPNSEYTQNISIPPSLERITFSLNPSADITLTEIIARDLHGTVFNASLRGSRVRMKVNLPGLHNVQNALAASACALALGIEHEAICEGIEKAAFPGMRSEIIISDGLTIIDDSYNANPGSMKAALDVLASAPHAVKIAVLGDMLELGDETAYWHDQLGRWVAESRPDRLIITGEMADIVKEAAYKAGLEIMRITVCADVEEIRHALPAKASRDAIVLVKASRSLKLDRVVQFLKEAA